MNIDVEIWKDPDSMRWSYHTKALTSKVVYKRLNCGIKRFDTYKEAFNDLVLGIRALRIKAPEVKVRLISYSQDF